ncbi:MAG: DinB family protein [Fimbriimonadaceae bacterium]|nr:DinB family protein [Fimbriimonadaceae bacterium]QYK59166.1 MAG: DinB family protein [Fimbriimonadaceae bacterium]
MDEVAIAKRRAVDEMEIFLRNFSHVPDDKLDWAPAPTAKSAIRIAAHTALYAGRFAEMIRERKLPSPDNLDAWIAQRDAEEAEVTDRQKIERIFREGTAQVLEALDGLNPEDLGITLVSGKGFSIPMRHLISLPAFHATLHTGQIDYLQTCWGDQHVYVE